MAEEIVIEAKVYRPFLAFFLARASRYFPTMTIAMSNEDVSKRCAFSWTSEAFSF